MEPLTLYIHELLTAQGFGPERAHLGALVIGVVAVALLAWLANLVSKQVILRAISAIATRTQFKWDDIMLENGVFTRLSHLAPALVINALIPDVLGETPDVLAGVGMAVSVYLTIIWLAVLFALLDAVHAIMESAGEANRMPIKGFVQAVKLVAALVGVIMILSTLLDKSPLYLLSGLGALTAVLLLVFRDALLGFAAGIMISVNQMIRIGDWIEMPKAGADGFVIDVSLTTVKVQNWDKTITTIPTYALISDSFKNWRGMFDIGGRRIKRALRIDMRSVRFADEALIEHWRKFALLAPYLAERQAEIDAHNRQSKTDLSILGNGRRITNLGTFRAYCLAYLRAHPHIHQDMLMLVRQLDPTEHGLPLEIYAFTNDTRWVVYEGVQADIFDHLVAIAGQFDLRIFQQPSGNDLQEALARVVPASMAS
ncbi:MAG TPA: mechanosensitive ion channel domain-containing protein [Opitutus sp.]|nr:mechanosensitive ion channel domain-containing protein [Opitutus sp.]